MTFTHIKPPPKDRQRTPGVYAELDDLMRMQFKAKGFTFLPRQPVHSLLSGRRASRIRGRGLNFEEIRGYLPGDDIRSIDWKVTARTKKTHVRVFTEERDRPTLLVVDQRIDMFFGSAMNMKSVTAAEAAALAAWRVVDKGDRIGAFVFGDDGVEEVRPHRSRATVMRILKAVVDKNHALGPDYPLARSPEMLNRVLENVARCATHNHLIIVISDFAGADETTRRLMTRLNHHNDAIGVLVHDPLAMKLPGHGKFVVTNGVLQMEMELERKKVRRTLHECYSERIANILSWRKELGIPMMPMNTAEPAEVQVRRMMGAVPGAPSGKNGDATT